MARSSKEKPRTIHLPGDAKTGNNNTMSKDARDVPAKIKKPYYVVCVGASAGGLPAIIEFIAQLPTTLNAAIFIVLHFSKTALGDILLDRLKRNTNLPCLLARDGLPVKAGHIYLALPDAHLLVKNEATLIGRGPAENRHRPSIDVLFRSAAASYGERTIGVVLTGMLNDGSIGMLAIRESGGHCIVQDPNEAEYPDMPVSVLQVVDVDYVLPLKKMGEIIANIIEHHELTGQKPPAKLLAESRISEKVATGVEEVNSLGEQTVLACPDCGGSLWKLRNGKVTHYRCHIGHSYTEQDLLVKQAESIENTLWIAVRMMEERRINFQRLEKENRNKGLEKLADSYHKHGYQLENHILKLKDLLFAVQKE